MGLHGEVIRYDLHFKFDAGTSHGVLRQKTSFFIKIFERYNPSVFGIGESGPLQGLSPDFDEDLELKILEVMHKISSFDKPTNLEQAYEFAEAIAGPFLPSIRFALEVAMIDLMRGGQRKIFHNMFTEGVQSIDINGLIWMGSKDFMLQQIEDKIESGYNCIKVKIGALDFETECKVLAAIREKFGPDQISIRLDANGAFGEEDAEHKLDKLSEYQVHSIEQPIAPGQINAMENLCRNSPVPIALDEELIGVYGKEKHELLEKIKPQFIILKPTLLGGFKETNEWIDVAWKNKIEWWITSALESNIGLNAICQFTAEYKNPLPQGLGTGQLYHNNIASPLEIHKGKIYYNNHKDWDLSTIGI
ncbi:MAG: o-succinylbenzoate synthase [Bacteroidota bacterium]|nr:o-succinylbenzoate synthase [Bacteroidota bacterium]